MPASSKKPLSNLAQRTLTAVILGPLVIWLLFASFGNDIAKYACYALVVLVFGLGLKEWITLTAPSPLKWLWWLGGTIYILGAGFITYLLIANESSYMPLAILLIFFICIVWATDIGAYFAGKLIGGPKLAPKISPKKTWAGAIGGLAAAIIAAFLLNILLFKSRGDEEYYSFAFGISIASQFGDLFISWVKRKFGVKDSGKLLPGHGGILDRIDGLIAGIWVGFAIFWNIK